MLDQHWVINICVLFQINLLPFYESMKEHRKTINKIEIIVTDRWIFAFVCFVKSFRGSDYLAIVKVVLYQKSFSLIRL